MTIHSNIYNCANSQPKSGNEPNYLIGKEMKSLFLGTLFSTNPWNITISQKWIFWGYAWFSDPNTIAVTCVFLYGKISYLISHEISHYTQSKSCCRSYVPYDIPLSISYCLSHKYIHTYISLNLSLDILWKICPATYIHTYIYIYIYSQYHWICHKLFH